MGKYKYSCSPTAVAIGTLVQLWWEFFHIKFFNIICYISSLSFSIYLLSFLPPSLSMFPPLALVLLSCLSYIYSFSTVAAYCNGYDCASTEARADCIPPDRHACFRRIIKRNANGRTNTKREGNKEENNQWTKQKHNETKQTLKRVCSVCSQQRRVPEQGRGMQFEERLLVVSVVGISRSRSPSWKGQQQQQ